jgi:hypothetical protein
MIELSGKNDNESLIVLFLKFHASFLVFHDIDSVFHDIPPESNR